jgi:hypothetical protein
MVPKFNENINFKSSLVKFNKYVDIKFLNN